MHASLIGQTWPQLMIGHPGERQVAERRQVLGRVVGANCRVSCVGTEHLARCHSRLECRGAGVDELDPLGGGDERIWHGLVLGDSGQDLDLVVQAVEMRDVQIGDNVDAGGEQVLDVLPALLMRNGRDIGVGQLVDQRHVGLAASDRIDVQLVEPGVVVPDAA